MSNINDYQGNRVSSSYKEHRGVVHFQNICMHKTSYTSNVYTSSCHVLQISKPFKIPSNEKFADCCSGKIREHLSSTFWRNFRCLVVYSLSLSFFLVLDLFPLITKEKQFLKLHLELLVPQSRLTSQHLVRSNQITLSLLQQY